MQIELSTVERQDPKNLIYGSSLGIRFFPDNAYYRYIPKTFIMSSDIILIENILSSFGIEAKMESLSPGSPPINMNSLGYSIRISPERRLICERIGDFLLGLRLD